MRILVLTQWYPPEPMKLLSDMTESLQELGHEVTVLTGFPNWPDGKIYQGYRIKLWQKETIEGVPIVRVPLFPNHSDSGLKRALNFISFVFTASILGLFLVRKPHIIHAIQPPTTCFSAWFLSRLWRIPYTYEIQDMWPETLQATNMIQNKKMLFLVGKFCDWAYKKSSAIRVISPGFKTNIINKGVPAEKIYTISNWVDNVFYAPKGFSDTLANKLGLSGYFIIMYAGTIGLAQGIGTVLDAAEQLQDEQRIKFVFIGDGIEMPQLKESVISRNLKNAVFLGRFPMTKMPELYALSDVLLLHLKDDPLFRITIPHKTLTYMSAGKPVLAAVEGNVGDIILDAEAGLVCPSGNPQLLASTARHFFNMTPTDRELLGKNGRREAIKNYSRNLLVGQIEKMLLDSIEIYNNPKRKSH